MTFLFKIGFLEISTIDVIDILLVSFLLYQLYKLMRGSVAVKIFLGVLSIYLFYLVVRAVKMDLLTSILGQFINVGVIAALILFQQEIRKFLVIIGKTTAFNNDTFLRLPWRKGVRKTQLDLTPLVEAAKILGGTNTGALIVFSKSSELKFYAESGDMIDAEISKRLLLSIFQKNSPLHDGAVIISNNRIKAARCILPVSESEDIPANYGLRHRAAIGMTEVTDSVVLVVSEETGEISIVHNGEIFSNLSKGEVRQKLSFLLFEDEEKIKKKDKVKEEPKKKEREQEIE